MRMCQGMTFAGHPTSDGSEIMARVARASLDPLTEPDRCVVVSDLVSRDSERELIQLFRVGLETHGVQTQKNRRAASTTFLSSTPWEPP